MRDREKTRQSIIEASADLFFNKGIIETTFSDISKQHNIITLCFIENYAYID